MKTKLMKYFLSQGELWKIFEQGSPMILPLHKKK